MPFSIPSGRSAALLLAALILSGAYAVWTTLTTTRATAAPEAHPQLSWAPCNGNAHSSRRSTFRPLGDAAAAALVTHRPENRRANSRPYTIAGRRYTAANYYRPSTAELRRFRHARTSSGQPVLSFNPYFPYVDGRDRMKRPSTDDLIQWVAHKWGIPEDWLRAEFVQESFWNQWQLGDESSVSAAWYARSPIQARVRGSHRVYESLGITQEKWIPDGSVGAGTEPLRWKSTAFNLDYQAATLRFYYDNPQGSRSAWGDRSYRPCQKWNSIGGWYEPYPWGNGGQQNYIASLRRHLSARDWTSADFVHWRPASLPPGVRLR